MKRFLLVFLLCFSHLPCSADAQSPQDTVWIQIEAQPTLQRALDRISDVDALLPDVQGYVLNSGWHAITLGPYARQDAEDRLRLLRAQGLIARDSYIALRQSFDRQYWPPGQSLGAQAPVALPSPSGQSAEAQAPTAEAAPADETPAQARRSEALLSTADREALQIALEWAGFYRGAIDGAFGRGTRTAMAAWQSAQGAEPTGILTTNQRAALLRQYNAPLEGLGLDYVRDLEAGIEIRLPLEMVQFDRYDPPFAHYEAKDDGVARVLLISQTGSAATLKSLYDVMQTLTIIPLDGPRELQRNNFRIVGEAEDFISETRVTRVEDEIKGFTLIWPTGDEERRIRLLEEMEESFTRRTGTLDPAAGLESEAKFDFISGLEVRKPRLSRSGFYVDATGAVVTTAAAVENCARVTLDDTHDASVETIDAAKGLALLRPAERLAPPAVARFGAAPPAVSAPVAVAGYSFGGQLTAPSLSYGTLSDQNGLNGEPELNRLAVDVLDGDEGGPVLDSRGQVSGMLLPLPDGARQLPDGVRFALTGAAIAEALRSAQVVTDTGTEAAALDPLELAELAESMTVLVRCWE